MRHLIRILLLCTIAMFSFTTIYAGEPMNLFIAIDTSAGNAHLEQKSVAARLGKYIAEKTKELHLGSQVEVCFFGSAGKARNPMKFTYQLLNRVGQKPQEVAGQIQNLTAMLPELVQRKKLKVQSTTNLVSSLQIMGQRINRSGKTRIIILSDMLEFSQAGNLIPLQTGKKGAWLTPAPKGFLEGIEVIALGAGNTLTSPQANQRLRQIWEAYFRRAGVSKFTYLTDY